MREGCRIPFSLATNYRQELSDSERYGQLMEVIRERGCIFTGRGQREPDRLIMTPKANSNLDQRLALACTCISQG